MLGLKALGRLRIADRVIGLLLDVEQRVLPLLDAAALHILGLILDPDSPCDDVHAILIEALDAPCEVEDVELVR